jgi:glycosyltransferase involved in cell wall biosynthesis
MRVLLASEEITKRPREGTLVFLMHLCRFLHKEADLTALYARGELEADLRGLRALSPRMLVTKELLGILRRETFDICIYVPSSGLTGFGLARGAVLHWLAKAPSVVIGLQERNVGGLHRALVLLGRPDLVLSPAKNVRQKLDRMGFNVDFIMPGYDARRFRPVTADERARLKAKYDFPAGKFVLLHVGHIKENRNLEVFLRYRDWGPDVQPVIKAGEVDASWAHRLRTAGIIVIDEYLDDVHELYQAADGYLFPVSNPTGAVDFPLSVIEACACNLPVLTTRFGALPEIIPEGNGFRYYDRVSEIAAGFAEIRRSQPDTAAKVKECSWEDVFRKHLSPHLRSLAKC